MCSGGCNVCCLYAMDVFGIFKHIRFTVFMCLCYVTCIEYRALCYNLLDVFE